MNARKLFPSARQFRNAAVLTVTAAATASLFVMGSSSAQAAGVPDFGVDGFDRTVAAGLGTATTGGVWTAQNESVFSISGSAAKVTGLQLGASASASLPVSAVDTDVQSTLKVPDIGTGNASLFYAVEARKQDDGSAYRGKVKVATDGNLSLAFSRTSGANETSLGSVDIPMTLTKTQTLRVELQVKGTAPVQLSGRAWLDGTTAPAWQYTLSDTDAAKITGAGKVGFWSYAATTGKPVNFQIPGFRAANLDATTTNPTNPPTNPGPPAGVKPTAANTGVPAGTVLTDYTGPLTITTDGTVIDGKAIYGDLRIQAKNVTVKNSYLHCGTAIGTYNSGCIDANSNANFNLQAINNTIKPDHPSYYRDGIVGHEFTAIGNHISGTNDGFGVFNKPGGSVAANVTLTGNYVHDLTRWNNDPAHSDGTHNDGIEVQGGSNISIRGNNIVGSVVAGDGLGVFGKHAGSALIVVQNTAIVSNLVVDGNWFDDAQNSVCINEKSYPNISMTLSNNLFGRNQYDFGNNSTYQIRIYTKAKSTITGLNTNKWEDTGALLTEGRNTGIRYNA